MHGSTFVPSVDSTDSKGSIVVSRSVVAQDPVAFPVETLDAILELPGSGYDLEKALMFRRVTRNAKSAEWVKAEDLVGQDLTDATVWYYFANWEDSEWVTVTGKSFSFVEDSGYDKKVTWEDDEEGDHYGWSIDGWSEVLLVRN